jgi:hypothetical protein
MTFNLLAVRSSDEDDDRLYPVPTLSRPPVLLDGSGTALRAEGLSVYEQVAGGSRQLLKLPDVEVDVTVTNARVALTCVKYDKGGGFVGLGAGGLAVSAVANGVSRARAAHRRSGKALVGHVRYPWLRIVGFSPRRGWGTKDELRLGVSVRGADGGTRPLFVDLTMPARTDVAGCAQQVVRAAARHRLEHWRVDTAQERETLEGLLLSQPLPAPPADRFALYTLPGYFLVSSSTARPSPAVPGGLPSTHALVAVH